MTNANFTVRVRVSTPYSKALKDLDGWVKAYDFFPRPFELCLLKCTTSIIQGWWTGQEYFSRKLGTEQVLFWKPVPYYCKHFT